MSNELKKNGFVDAPVQSMSGAIEMFGVVVAEDILTKDDNGQNAKLDVLVETISLRAQPVFLRTITGAGPYSLVFAVEHKDAIVPADLKAALVATGEFAEADLEVEAMPL